MTFIGEQSILERMRWEISEDRLTLTALTNGFKTPRHQVHFPGRPIRVPQLRRSRSSLTSMSSGFTTKRRVNSPMLSSKTPPTALGMTENISASIGREICLPTSISWRAAKADSASPLNPASYAVTDPKRPDAPVFGGQSGWMHGPITETQCAGANLKRLTISISQQNFS